MLPCRPAEPRWRRALHRLPWLLVGPPGRPAAALVVAGCKECLATQVAVAFFIPAIVCLADAVGTRTEAVVVRGLSLEAPRFARQLAGELAAGTIVARSSPCSRCSGLAVLQPSVPV